MLHLRDRNRKKKLGITPVFFPKKMITNILAETGKKQSREQILIVNEKNSEAAPGIINTSFTQFLTLTWLGIN